MDHVPPGPEHDARPGAGEQPGALSPLPARARRKRTLFAVLLGCAVLLFAGLGAWQVERRGGKLALIEAVDRRAHGAPVPAPGPAGWNVTAKDDAYRRVRVGGEWLRGQDTAVQALTELGSGSWVMTPLRTAAGWTVLVNRGFIPADRHGMAEPPPAGPAEVTGLLRITEPGGGFLRSNDPANGHWFSRDVSAIAQARGLDDVAPYFIDADATPGAGKADGAPVGGLTVIAFPNNHLVYALTWFSLCGLSAAGLRRVLCA